MTDMTASRPLRGQSRSRIARLTASLGAAVVALGALGLVAAPSATAADNGSWSVFPTTAEGSLPRTAFSFEVAAGATITDSVALRNNSPDVLRLVLYPADAFNAEGGGGFALRQQNEESTDVGAWVDLTRTTVTIAPGREIDVPYTMTVPPTATPGDHAGGIVAVNAEAEGVQESDGVVVDIKRAVGTRIYVRVQGPLTPAMSVTDLRVEVTDRAQIPLVQQGKAQITYTVVNTGNTRLSPQQALRITGLFGQTLAQPALPPAQELLPGQSMTLTQQWDSVPAFNQLNARVELVANDPRAGISVAAADTVLWVVPWLLVGVGALLGIAVWLASRVARRRREPLGAAERGPFPTLGGRVGDSPTNKENSHVAPPRQ